MSSRLPCFSLLVVYPTLSVVVVVVVDIIIIPRSYICLFLEWFLLPLGYHGQLTNCLLTSRLLY